MVEPVCNEASYQGHKGGSLQDGDSTSTTRTKMPGSTLVSNAVWFHKIVKPENEEAYPNIIMIQFRV